MVTRYTDYDLSARNTFRMKVRCALYIEVTEEADLPVLEWDALPQPVMVMGGGSNLLFTGDFPGTIVHYGALCLGIPGRLGPGPRHFWPRWFFRYWTRSRMCGPQWARRY